MSDLVVEFLKSSNFIQLIAIGIMFWFFYNRLDSKITAFKTELKQEIAATKTELKQEIAATKTELRQEIAATKTELKQEIKDLAGKIEDVDRRFLQNRRKPCNSRTLLIWPKRNKES